MLQADPKVKAAMTAKPAAAPAAPAAEKPAAEPAATPAPTAEKPAAEPTAEPTAPTAAPAADAGAGKLSQAQQDAMKAKLQGKRAAGKTAGTTTSGFKDYTKAASSQRIVGANPDGSPKIQQIKASKINLGNRLSEALAAKVEEQKHKMFETSLARGESSLFRTK